MIVRGISGARGIGLGKVYVYTHEDVVIPKDKIEESAVADEQAQIMAALDKTVAQLEAIRDKTAQTMGKKESAIFDAHILIAQDPALIDGAKNLVAIEQCTAAEAVSRTVEQFAAVFSAMDDEYMRARGADIKDIGDRLLRNVLGMTPLGLSHLTEEVILVANDLTPSDTASLDKRLVKGIVTACGGPTSHAAIMARTLEIPAVMGVGYIDSFTDGARAIVKGSEGEVLLDPTETEWQEYAVKADNYQRQVQELKNTAKLEAVTKDGHAVLLYGNMGKVRDIERIKQVGGTGVGLFRTEFLYMENDELPSLDKQFATYKQAAEAMEGQPVVIRTMDIGGDKELKCLNLPKEMNPFLGYRAIRICLRHPDILRTQLKAVLKASAYGKLSVMYPMISSVEEVKAANAILNEMKEELRQEGTPFDDQLPVGIMVEIPAVAISAEYFAPYVDFFSIGTNDLCQYTLAVDRMNERISHLYQPLHPSVLHLIKNTIDASHKYNKITGMCGEMAGDPVTTMILLGLGLDEFSMNAASIPMVKHIIRSVTLQECQKIASLALFMDTAELVLNLAKTELEKRGLNL